MIEVGITRYSPQAGRSKVVRQPQLVDKLLINRILLLGVKVHAMEGDEWRVGIDKKESNFSFRRKRLAEQTGRANR